MGWTRFKRKQFHRCNCCGGYRGLAYTHLLIGCICLDCYKKYYSKSNIKMIYGINLTEAERIIYNNEFTRLITTALIDIYSRYTARLKSVNTDMSIELDSIYNKSSANIQLRCTTINNEKLVIYKVINNKTGKEYVSRYFKYDSSNNKYILTSSSIDKN